jgi:hypothetical protein
MMREVIHSNRDEGGHPQHERNSEALSGTRQHSEVLSSVNVNVNVNTQKS